MIEGRPSGESVAAGDLAQLLRQCVQCGLCLPHCATWLATGNEVQSPRGRLILLEEMLLNAGEGDSGPPSSFLQAFDQCIGCRACETACPSGVPFSLLQYGQELAAAQYLPASDRPRPAVPKGILRRLDRPEFLAGLSRAGKILRFAMTFLAGKNWRRRLDKWPLGIGSLVRLVGSVPDAPASDISLIRLLDGLCGRRGDLCDPKWDPDAEGINPGPVVAFFEGCANAGMLGESSRRTRDLLAAAGCKLELVGNQDCCGALAAHSGRPGRAADLRRRNREAFARTSDPDALVVVEAAGCGHELKNYGGDFSTRVTDAIVLLAGLDIPSLAETPLKVVYHDPCHARHAQGIIDEPRKLLGAIPGLTLVEPVEAEVCCGSGGAWGLRYPDLSEELGRRKAENLAATGADLVVTSNPGCLGQITDALLLVKPGLPILPLTDLLWYAAVRGQKKGRDENPPSSDISTNQN